MEILQDNLLNIIREKCSSGWSLDVFEDHIIVNITGTEKDFRPTYAAVKQEITRCIKTHFPERVLISYSRSGTVHGTAVLK